MSEQTQSNRIAPADTGRFFTPPLITIFVTVFIDLIGFGMVIPILPLYAETPPFNATPFEIGMLFAIYSWMQFFFTPVLGRLSDIYGRRPILVISLFGSAVGYLVIGLANTLLLVFVGRIVSGVTGGNISTAQAYVADVTTKENRAKGMGLFGAAFGLGFVLGPAIAGVLSMFGAAVPFYFAGALSFANTVAVYFLLPESVKKAAAGTKRLGHIAEFMETLRHPEIGVLNLIYFLLVVAFSIMTYAIVLYTGFTFGFTAVQNGYFFAYVGFMAILGQGVLFNRLVDRFGESRLAATGCIMMAAGLFSVPFVGPERGGLAGLLIGSAFLSFGNAFASPALTSLVSKMSHDDEQGKSLGIMQSSASLARAIGPTIGGFLLNNSLNRLDTTTIFRTFWTASGIMFVAFIASVYFAKTVRPKMLV